MIDRLSQADWTLLIVGLAKEYETRSGVMKMLELLLKACVDER
jgi:hypothetical protein